MQHIQPEPLINCEIMLTIIGTFPSVDTELDLNIYLH